MPPWICSLSTAPALGRGGPLLGRVGLDRQRVDLAADALAERAVHELVARERPHAPNCRADHARAKCVLSSERTSTRRPGSAWRISSAICCGIHGRDLKASAAARKADLRRAPGAIMARSRGPRRHACRQTRPPGRRAAAGLGRGVALEIEADALAALRAAARRRASPRACRLCLACHGRVVVTGMGKSGHIARKIAATLASTGTPAFFLHPGEAGHGDIGMITRGDVLLALSNSGRDRRDARAAAVPEAARRPADRADRQRRLDARARRRRAPGRQRAEEACPLNLAPTASTTATLAMGDALAVALLRARGFTDRGLRPLASGRQPRPAPAAARRGRHAARRRGAAQSRPDAPLREGLLEMTRRASA